MWEMRGAAAVEGGCASRCPPPPALAAQLSPVFGPLFPTVFVWDRSIKTTDDRLLVQLCTFWMYEYLLLNLLILEQYCTKGSLPMQFLSKLE